MKTAWSMALGLAVMLVMAMGVMAEDKEKTLKGTITCAKCGLKIEGQDKCHTVIQVKGDDDKEVVYWLDTKSSKENHKKICTESKKGKVTGTVKEKDGKQWVTATKVEFDD